MTLELVRDMLRFDQIIGEGQSQTMVDRDLIVPDVKPDIDRILSVEGMVNITNKEVEQDRVSVEGTVDFSILYSVEGAPEPIYSMNQSANFSNYINVDGAMPKMDADVHCDIEHIDARRLNGRKINIQCVVNMDTVVTDSVPIDAIKEVTGIPDIQLLRDTVTIDETTADETAQNIVRAAIEIPEELPAAAEILKSKAFIHKKESRVEDGKIVISGSVLVPVLYISKGEDTDVYRVEEDMVFSHIMDIPGVTPEMNCWVDYRIEDVFADISAGEEEDGRKIDVEVVIGLRAKTVSKNEIPVIIDAYGPSTLLESETRDISLNTYFGEGVSQAVVKESLNIPEETPEIEKIYDVSCRPAVTDYKVEDEKVVVEGVLELNTIYLGRGEDRRAYSFMEEVPFKSAVVIPGCKKHMKPKVAVDIENLDFGLLTKDEVEVKVIINCGAKVYDKLSKDFIIKMEEAEGELEFHKASITIYIVQPRDTLWKIAKKYHTTIDNIIKTNEITDIEKVLPGMKLIIPGRM